MKIFSISLFFSCSIILFPILSLSQEIHVSLTGKDDNNGSSYAPVASLEKAKELARNLNLKNGLPKGGVSVIIHQGTYDLKESLVLDEKDGGTKDLPNKWMAAPGEQVNITGGKTINPAHFKKIKDPKIICRLSENAQQHIRQVNLREEGVNDLGHPRQYGHGLPVVPSTIELFFNGAPMNVARYPNQGTVKIGKVVDMGSIPRIGDKTNRGAIFAYTDPRHKKWVGLDNFWIQGTLNYGFADDYNQVDYIDTLKGVLKLKQPHLYGVASGKDFQEYVALNILEELDSPGEWYVDEKSGFLYFWPPADLKKSLIQVSVLEDPIVCMEGTSYLQIQGLTIEAGRGIGVYIERCNFTLLAGCTIRNLGCSGVLMGQGAKLLDENASIDDYVGVPQSRQIGSLQNHMYRNTAWNRNAGSNNGVLSCDVYNTGSGGIYISGGDKKTLTPGNSFAENCKIHNYTRRNKFTWAGIRVDGVGNRISHNEIYDSDWHGIFVHGNNHVFEFNYVHDVTLNSNDTSPWYIGRNPSDRGNIVRYNFFENCGNPKRMNMGIYCDDSSADVYVFGNVFNNMQTTHGVLFSNSGWDLVMKNNIVIQPIAHTAEISAHYYTWAAGQVKETFGKNGLLRDRLTKDIDFKSPPYSSSYPSLLPYLDVIQEDREWEGMRSRGNVLEGNLIVGGPENPIALLGGKYAQMEGKNNWVTKDDPGFVDLKNKNFNLRSDSKVFQMIPGFQAIPFDSMGLYKDQFRK